MNQDIQKIILRATIVFALVFGLVFGVVDRLTGDVSRYEAKTTLVLLPRNQESTEALSKIDADVAVMLGSETFQREISDARYAATEEWETFSLSVEHPVTGVFVFSYRDNSADPYAAREAMETVREEALLAVTRKYDALRDIEVRFLDAGTPIETSVSKHNLVLELLIAALIAGALEGILFGISRISFGRALQNAVREKVQESSAVHPWWLAPSSVSDSAQTKSVFEATSETVYTPVASIATELRNEREISFEKKNPELPNVPELPVFAPALEARQEPPRTFSPTGAPPTNLPILKDIPDILKPTWQGNSLVKEEAPEEVFVFETDEVSARTERKEEIVREEEVDPMEEDSALFEAPIKNPEPTAEELKARLNRLLRGEMG